MKFSLFPSKSFYNQFSEVGDLSVAKDYNLLINPFHEELDKNKTFPDSGLPLYWFTNKTSILVLPNRTTEIQATINATPYSKSSTSTIKLEQPFITEETNKTTQIHEADDLDEFKLECFANEGIDEDLSTSYRSTSRLNLNDSSKKFTTESKNPILGISKMQLTDPIDSTDDLKPFNLGYGYTPNTASNSSVSGSSKFIGMKSKLNPKSQVYKVNTSRSTHGFGSKGYNQFMEPARAGYPQTSGLSTVHSKDSCHSKSSSQQNLYNKQTQYQSNKFGAFSTPYFVDMNAGAKSKSNIVSGAHKFSSDTRIIPDKHFTWFGDDEIQEIEFSQSHPESDSEEDSNRMANCIPTHILEEAESPQHHRRQHSQGFNIKRSQEEKDCDYGSVSSGSEEKDDDSNIPVFHQPKSNMAYNLNNKSPLVPKQYSPDYGNLPQQLKKEVH